MATKYTCKGAWKSGGECQDRFENSTITWSSIYADLIKMHLSYTFQMSPFKNNAVIYKLHPFMALHFAVSDLFIWKEEVDLFFIWSLASSAMVSPI